MSRTKTANKKISSALGQKINDYKVLVKFKLNLLVVFSAIMAYLICAQGAVSWVSISLLALGGFLVTGASNALNQVLEKQHDLQMNRTKDRPVATGRMDVSEAVMAAGFMSLIGTVILSTFNAWTGMLGMIALISYAFIYTCLLYTSPSPRD